LLLRDISSLNSFLNDYFSSGRSIFLPFLPYSNLLWFLPKGDQIIKFSTGQLIDIILLINIIAFIERSGYHYYMKVCLSKNYIGSQSFDYQDQTCDLSRETSIFFGLNQYSSYHFQDQELNIEFKQKKNQHENNSNFEVFLRKERESKNLEQNRILLKKSYKKNLNSYSSEFIQFFNTLLINYYLHPQISNSTYSIKDLKLEG
jgi:hypothetical protein